MRVLAMSVFDYEANQESIYNLIPAAEQEIVKPPMYRSKHNGKVPPTYSTFGNAGTSRPAGNCDGADDGCERGGGKHKAKHSSQGIGRSVKGEVDPKKFLRRGQGTGGSSLETSEMPAAQKFERKQVGDKRAAVPKQTDKPVMGLKTEKNFVVANAVDNILAAPKQSKREEAPATLKRDMGQPPKYLQRVRAGVEAAREAAATLSAPAADPFDTKMRKLTETEKHVLIQGLQDRWAVLNKQFASLTFSLDTVTKVSRKEAQEAELERIEKSIARLKNKQCIYVYDDIGSGFDGCGLNGPAPPLKHAATV